MDMNNSFALAAPHISTRVGKLLHPVNYVMMIHGKNLFALTFSPCFGIYYALFPSFFLVRHLYINMKCYASFMLFFHSITIPLKFIGHS